MATETINYKLNFNGESNTSINYAFDPSVSAYRYRTEEWELDMEVIESGFYGYGYGTQFYDLDAETPGLDYFHVLGIKGGASGYGIDGTQGGTISSYTFGWGYEFTSAVISDNTDELSVKVTVRENGVVQPNVKVIFRGSPGVSLNQNVGYTDSNGEIIVTATMDNSININTSFESLKEVIDFTVYNTISDIVVYGNIIDQERKQFRAQLPLGTKLEDLGLEVTDDQDFLSGFRVNIKNAGNNNEYGGNLFNIVKIIEDEFVDSGGDRIPYYEIVYETSFDYPAGNDALSLLGSSIANIDSGSAVVSPDPPQAGGMLRIIYDPTGGPLENSNQILIYIGYNDWQEVFSAIPMKLNTANGYWEYYYNVTSNAAQIEFIFSNGLTLDNNSDNDWVYEVTRQKLSVDDVSNPLVLAVIGDFGWEGEDLKDVSDLVKSWNPEYILTTGDNNYDFGEVSTIDKNIGQYFSQFIYPYLGSYGIGADTNRFYPCPGNHDWDSATGLQPYLDYFTLPGIERYYDFRIRNVHFFMLDSDPREPDGVTEDSVQGKWLQSSMAASDAKYKLVFLHHSPYTTGTVHGESEFMQWPFADWGATAVFGGHEHNYERLMVGGIPYFVVGHGGRSIYNNFSSPPSNSASQSRYANGYGALQIQIGDNEISFHSYAVNGNVLIDSFKIKNGQVVPPLPSPESKELPFPDIFENAVLDIVEAQIIDEGGTVSISEELPLTGYLSVRAIIEKQLGKDQGNINIETDSIQLFEADSTYKLNFDAYSFQRFFNYA